ncbi:uncharacterized protein LOC117966451 [Acipenser ruthenus]|uniref:uncharacterized protein LOC117966451 n=1 Tax=Acipenser ruthenus TaxID=7906 RepID=UPI0027427029|nr:uncharacterized protein LOC117966451 [Acipenser ruthenus]
MCAFSGLLCCLVQLLWIVNGFGSPIEHIDLGSSRAAVVSLGTDQKSDAVLHTNGEFLSSSDTFLEQGDIRKEIPRNATDVKERMWPKDGNTVKIPYSVSKQYNEQSLALVKQAFAEFEEDTCIRFVPVTTEEDYIVINPVTRCYSSVGHAGGGQLVSLGLNCLKRDMGVATHVLMHVLGFWHEHTRVNRDKRIAVKRENVSPELASNLKIHEENMLKNDYNSILHYSQYAFSVNQQQTMTPIPDTNVPIRQRKALSESDIKRINMWYNCENPLADGDQGHKNTDSHLLVEKPLKTSEGDILKLGVSPPVATPVFAAARETTGPASSPPFSASHASSPPVSASHASSPPVSASHASSTAVSASHASSTAVSASGTPVSASHASGTLVSASHASSTPVSALHASSPPVSVSHASSTPVSASSTPVSASHASGTPVSASHASGTPVSASHASSPPVSASHASSTAVSASSTPVSASHASGTPVSASHASGTPVSASHASSQANLSTGTSTGHDQTTLQSNEVNQSLPPTPSPRPASLFCNFELDLCGWENCRSGDFNWLLRRERPTEFETQTLPDGHVSCRNFAGQYLYLEAVFPRESGETAVLISPVFEGPKCLSFWYSLIGDGVGALHLYVAYVSSPDSWHKLWSASGAMPRKWYFEEIDLFVKPEEKFQILLEGTISNNYCGDAAIDDLSVSENRCTSFKRLHKRRELPATPAPEGSPSVSAAPVLPPPEVLETLFCDFEKGLCGWSQCTSDDFDWELHQERLPPLLSATQPDSQGKCRNFEDNSGGDNRKQSLWGCSC